MLTVGVEVTILLLLQGEYFFCYIETIGLVRSLLKLNVHVMALATTATRNYK